MWSTDGCTLRPRLVQRESFILLETELSEPREGWVDLFTKSIEVGDNCLIEYLPDGEAVLLNTSSEQYFGLDEIGVEMWNALSSSHSIEDAYRALLDEYDVAPDQLRSDLERLVEDLAAHGLLEITSR